MTSSHALPTATTTPAGTVDQAAPAPGLWAQTHALRTLADFLDRHGVEGLHLVLHGDRIDLHLHPQASATGTQAARIAAVDRLAAALGATAHHTANNRHRDRPDTVTGWHEAHGHLAGHLIRVLAHLTHEATA